MCLCVTVHQWAQMGFCVWPSPEHKHICWVPAVTRCVCLVDEVGQLDYSMRLGVRLQRNLRVALLTDSSRPVGRLIYLHYSLLLSL